MSRPTLKLARASKRTGPPLSLVKKAIRLFRGRGVAKAVYRRNALRWLDAMRVLGDKHTLHRSRPEVKWGQPGEPGIEQVFAPRRLGGK